MNRPLRRTRFTPDPFLSDRVLLPLFDRHYNKLANLEYLLYTLLKSNYLPAVLQRENHHMQNQDLKNRVYHILRGKLINCEYAPGSLLNEAQLSEELGVSRTPVREALNRIEHEGFVRIMPKKGIYVTDITLNDVVQIFETRQAVEPLTLRMAAPALSREMLLDFREKFSGEPLDVHEGYELDTAMHLYIIDQCGSRFLIGMMHKVFDENTRVIISSNHNKLMLHDARTEHTEILDLLLGDDVEAAQRAMHRHIGNCKRAALDYFYNNPACPPFTP